MVSIPNYRYTDVNGTTRHFPLYYETSNTCHTAGTTTSSGPSLDATGYVMNYYTSYPFNGSPKAVIAPDGTTVWTQDLSMYTSTRWKDTNGNFMDQDTGGNPIEDTSSAIYVGVTDTLNRITTVETQYLYTHNYDTAISGGGSSLAENWHPSSGSYVSISTGFYQSGVTDYCCGADWSESTITAPDGTYTFTYDSYDEVSSMTLPSGETINFTYSNFTDAQGNIQHWIHTVAWGGGTWTFTPVASCGTGCDQQVTVTRPSGDDTVYSFKLDNGAWNTTVQKYSGSATSGTLMLTTQNGFDRTRSNPLGSGHAFVEQTSTTTSWAGAAPSSHDLVSGTQSDFDSFTYTYQGTNYTDGSRGNVTEHREYAYASNSTGGLTPGSLLRKQDYTYLHDSNSSYISPNIVNRLTDVQTKNATGTKVAETITTYDSYGSGGVASLASMTGITHHDDTNFGTGNSLRGNPTLIQSWVSGSTYLSTIRNYDMTGQVVSTKDSNGNTTSLSYSNNFTRYCGWPTIWCSDSTAPSTAVNAFVTQATLPVSGTMNFGYSYWSGKQATSTDQNSATTTSTYAGPYDAHTGTYLPYGGYTTTTYTSANQYNFTNWASTTAQLTLDSMARPQYQYLLTDPSAGQSIIYTTYDSSGRVSTKTNPYRSTSDPTYGTTSYTYDGLDRVTQTTLPDSSISHTYYGSSVTSSLGGQTSQLCSSSTYGLGFPILSKDPAGKKRQSWRNSLGRLIEADEFFTTSSPGSTVATCYQYDLLGNVSEVDQGTQTRTFSYDGLSRLTSETTPEAGTVNYYYTTSGGTLCSGNSKVLCRVADARSITTAYTYDAENRLTGKSYSNGDLPVEYYYDQTSYNGLTITNGKGRRTGMCDNSASGTCSESTSGKAAWSFNSDGKIITEKRRIDGVTESISYSYLLNDSVNQITYPSGLPIAYDYSYGILIDAYCNVSYGQPCNGTTFTSSAAYAPHGPLASVTLGSQYNYTSGGFPITYSYNNRLQPSEIKTTNSDGSVTLMDQTYSFVNSSVNNGTVASITNTLHTGRSQSFTYDEINRLATAQSAATSGTDCWSEQYTYDRYANLSQISPVPGGCAGGFLSLSVSNTTNQVTNPGYRYDAAGDLLADGFSTYNWNAEGRMEGTAGFTYIYDGDGKRVAKVIGGHGRGDEDRNPDREAHNSEERLYWYGLSGEVLAESDLSGNIASEYIYFNGARIARRDVSSGNIYYLIADSLGSARMIATASGTVVDESDFYPYGGERMITGSPTDNHYKFTGDERDSESGLDHTEKRQYTSITGRWLSPDSLRGKATDPQSWNRYSYTAGNPVSRTDSNGSDWTDVFNLVVDSVVAQGYHCLIYPDPITGEYPSDIPTCSTIYWMPWIPLSPLETSDSDISTSISPNGTATITLSTEFVNYLVGTGAIATAPAVLRVVLAACIESVPCVVTVGLATIGVELAIWLQQAKTAKDRANKQAADAVDAYERECGITLLQHQLDQIHDDITKQDLDFQGIIDYLKSTFGCPAQEQAH